MVRSLTPTYFSMRMKVLLANDFLGTGKLPSVVSGVSVAISFSQSHNKRRGKGKPLPLFSTTDGSTGYGTTT
jgi:hypothetical protein